MHSNPSTWDILKVRSQLLQKKRKSETFNIKTKDANKIGEKLWLVIDKQWQEKAD